MNNLYARKKRQIGSFKGFFLLLEMKPLLTPLLLIFLIPAFGQNKPGQTLENQGDKVCEIIARLPEVIKADNYCKKLSNGKRHLVTLVGSYPTGGQNSYMIKVAEDNGSSLHSWFLFVYEPDTKRIEFYDPVKDKYISLKKWQKNYKAYI